MKPVARAGDVQAESTGTKYTGEKGAATGVWTPGPVSETLEQKAGSDGSRVVVSASCTFSFEGPLDADPKVTVTGTSEVTLSPQARVLTVGGSAPLVHGDEAGDTNGNKVSVSSSATWRTA